MRRLSCLAGLAFLVITPLIAVPRARSDEDMPVVPDRSSPWLLVLRRQGWVGLRDGDLVRPGDRLIWRCAVKETVWVYVLNRDPSGARFVLFPLPSPESMNPLPPGSHTLPGKGIEWVVTSASGEEVVEAIVSRHRCLDIEDAIRSFPRASPATRPVPLPIIEVPGAPLTLPIRLHTPGKEGDRLVLRLRLRNPAPGSPVGQ